MPKNDNLKAAKKAKFDEFYTLIESINDEVYNYCTNREDLGLTNQFYGKTVLCNCDDPEWSNFWNYFVLNFNAIGLKKLISTHYEPSGSASYKLEFYGEFDSDGKPKYKKIQLYGNGDFESDECIEILKESDICCTNPPFSKFISFINTLIKYDKKFLVIGNITNVTSKEIFPLIKDNKIWLGVNSGSMKFRVPDYYVKDNVFEENGVKYAKFGNICWYTNMDNAHHHEEMQLSDFFYGNEEKYPKYDNYDAIHIASLDDIPCDYEGLMGVPVSIFMYYNPEQFEIIASSQTGCHPDSMVLRSYKDYKGYEQSGKPTGRTGSTCGNNPMLLGDNGKNVYYMNDDGRRVYSTFSRVFIKLKHPKNRRRD